MNGILQHWSSCRGGGRPQFRTHLAGLRRTGRIARRELQLRGLWLEEKDRVQKLSARKRLGFQGGVTFLQGVGRREKKICVNLTKRLRTASILRDCAHVTGCVFWDGCFIRCLLHCCISCSWRLMRVLHEPSGEATATWFTDEQSFWDA